MKERYVKTLKDIRALEQNGSGVINKLDADELVDLGFAELHNSSYVLTKKGSSALDHYLKTG